MHLILNCIITDEPMVPGLYAHKTDNTKSMHSRLQIFLFCLSTYREIDFQTVKLFVELGQDYKREKQRVFDMIYEVVGSSRWSNVEIFKYRNSDLTSWRAAVSGYRDSDLIYLNCNDDHFYYGAEPAALKSYSKTVSEIAEVNPFINLLVTHWQESLAYAEFPNGNPLDKIEASVKNEISHDSNCIVCSHKSTIGTQVLTAALLKRFFESDLQCDLRRTDPIFFEDAGLASEPWICLVPKQELVRHFDGYSHHNIISNKIIFPWHVPETDSRLVIGQNRSKKITDIYLFPMGKFYLNGEPLRYRNDCARIDMRELPESMPAYLANLEILVSDKISYLDRLSFLIFFLRQLTARRHYCLSVTTMYIVLNAKTGLFFRFPLNIIATIIKIIFSIKIFFKNKIYLIRKRLF